MNSNNQEPAPAAPQRPQVKRRSSRISWIWLVPILAAFVGASLLIRDWMHVGPTITISFESAEGLEAGSTRIRYKNVVVGVVTDLSIAEDRSNVLVTAELDRQSADYITQPGTRFWVVRPRVGVGGVSGLNTLLSGAYIAVDTQPEEEEAEAVYHFEGLEFPPEVTSGRPGTRYTLVAPDLGYLELGSPVFYRRIPVGRVIGYELGEAGRAVNIHIFVDAPNDQYVTSDTRFWNTSGIDVSLDAGGISLQTGSLTSVLSGGVSFASANEANVEQAPPNTKFELAPRRDEAMADPDGPPFTVQMHFAQSVRGLRIGAPVDFRGLELGKVVDIDLEYDRSARQFYANVTAELYPLRFGPIYRNLIRSADDVGDPGALLFAPLVEHGLRAQMRASNLLTGQQYIALDFFPDAAPETLRRDAYPVIVPTVGGSFDRLQQQLTSIVSKVEAIPFEGIAEDIRGSLGAITSLLEQMGKDLTPQTTATLRSLQKTLDKVDGLLARDSSLNTNVERTMRDVAEAAKALRDLADYLQANPTSVIRGRAPGALNVTP